jgi:hypothetical protein
MGTNRGIRKVGRPEGYNPAGAIEMKRDPKQQLISLIKGLRMDEGVPLEDLLEKSPKYFTDTGTTFARLAQIGMNKINADAAEAKKKRKNGATIGAFGRRK